MRLKPGNAFRPGLWPTLAMLVLCALFLRLGVWQWDRAEYKRGLLAQYQAQRQRAPVSLDALLGDPTLESFPSYLRVRAAGNYDPGRQLLLEDITHEGQAGFEVLTPLLMQGGVIALVDRGWVPMDAKGGAPDLSVDGKPRLITAGIGLLPMPGIRLGQAPAPAAGWPKTLLYPTLDDLRPLYGPKLMTPVLHLEPGEPDGYTREETLDVGLPPSRHLGYAFQWTALGLAVFGVWLVVNLRRGRKQGEDT